MVDQTNAILTKSLRSIEKNLGRVAKKKFKDDTEVGDQQLTSSYIISGTEIATHP